jgi:hypothetical protein
LTDLLALGNHRRSLHAQRAHHRCRVLDREHVSRLAAPEIRLRVEHDVAWDVARLHDLFQRTCYEFGRAGIDGRRSIECRDFFRDRGDQLRLGQPHEVVEDHRYRPSGFFDVEGHRHLPGRDVVAVAHAIEQPGRGEAVGRRRKVSDGGALPDLQAAQSRNVRGRVPPRPLHLDARDVRV